MKMETTEFKSDDVPLMNSNLQTIIPKPDPPFYSAAFNLANATIGSGILGLPYVFMKCGVLLGIFVLILFGLLANFTFQLLIDCSKELLKIEPESYYYEDLGKFYFGKAGSLMVKISIIVTCLGSCTSYMVLIGDFMLGPLISVLGPNHWYTSRPFVTAVLALSILLPLSLLKNFSSLRFTSLLSIVIVFFFIIFVITGYAAKIGADTRTGDVRYFRFNTDILSVLSIATFAFNGHAKILPIAREFTDKNKVKVAVHCSVTICFVTYLLAALFGYLTFLDATNSNLTLSYPQKRYVDVVRLGLLVTILFTYPTANYPCKTSIDNLIFPNKERAPNETIRLSVITCCIMVITYTLGIFVPSVGLVFALSGAIGATLVTYLLPSMFYWKSRMREKMHPKKLAAISLFFFGIVFGVISTVFIILKAVQGEQT